MEKLLTDLKLFLEATRKRGQPFGPLLMAIEAQIPAAEADLAKLKAQPTE